VKGGKSKGIPIFFPIFGPIFFSMVFEDWASFRFKNDFCTKKETFRVPLKLLQGVMNKVLYITEKKSKKSEVVPMNSVSE